MATGRVQRGWELAKRSYRVLSEHRILVVFPLLSLAASIATVVVFFGPGAIIYVSDAQEPVLIIFGVITLYLLILVTMFFNTALAATASRLLAGESPSLSEGFDAARDRLGPIAQWAFLQTVVGVIIIALEAVLRDGIVGRLVAGAANLSWGVATFFIVPVVALEGLGPRDAFHRSVALLRERWGEGAVGTASINTPILAVTLPILLLFGGGGFVLADTSPALSAVLFGVAAVVLVTAMVVGSTLTAVFRVALYQYATTGETPAEFSSVDLGSAFRAKAKAKRVRTNA